MKRFCTALFLVISFGMVGVCWADQALTPASSQAFIDDLAKRAVTVFSKKGLTPPEAQKEFKTLFEQSFSVDYLGRFVLGQYWGQATTAQQQEYEHLFEEWIVDVYSERFSNYAGETLHVNSAQPVGSKDMMVNSVLNRPNGKPPVKIDWRVRQMNGDLRIIDVVVEDVSMSITQRSEFASLIENRKGGVQALIDELERRVDVYREKNKQLQ